MGAEDTCTFWFPGMDQESPTSCELDHESPHSAGSDVILPVYDDKLRLLPSRAPHLRDLAVALEMQGCTLQAVIKWIPEDDMFCAALACSLLRDAVFAHTPDLSTSIAGVCTSFERLNWAYELPEKPPWWNEELCSKLAGAGNLTGLQWARENGCTWGRSTFYAAAGAGHLEVLYWLKENKCPWNANTCYAAAGAGHLEVLQWLRGNKCPWNANTCYAAARGGHLEVLQWAQANGCRWNANTCSAAAGGGHLEILKWARTNGCEWDANTCYAAASAGHLSIVKWCRANGCQWDESQAGVTKERVVF